MSSGKRVLVITLILAVLTPNLYGQADTLNRKRLNTLLIGASAGYVTGLVLLNELWYSDLPRQSFQTFNDSREWKQVDKIGHLYTAFQLSHAGSRALQWAGMDERKADLWSSAAGFVLMLPIEIMDGYSDTYGASVSDVVANLAGSALYLGQKLLWNKVRIHPKYSFSPSNFAQFRPEVLGKNTLQQMIKDYNGQTYWLSFDIYSFLKKESKFPKWLNLSVGYGANGMVYANDTPNEVNGYNPYREYYLGLDIDLTHIKSHRKGINTLIFFANMIRIPAPALSFTSEGNTRFHFLFF